MERNITNIGELFRTIIGPLIQDIADVYNASGDYRAMIGSDHPTISQSKAISSIRGRSPRKTIIHAVSIKVYNANHITTVSVFYPQESQFVFVAKLGVIGSEQIKLEEVTPEILEQKIKQYLPQIT